MRRTHRATATALAATLAAALLAGAAPGALATVPDAGRATATAPPAPTAAGGGALRTVTLVTGDRVVVDSRGRVASVLPAEGREDVPFAVRRVGEDTLVVPGDAQRLLARGVLDQRLFDVSGLIAAGYDDAARDDLPLIVTYSGARADAAGALRAAGAEVARELPSVDGQALLADKAGGPALWQALTDAPDAADPAGATASATAPGVERIWLDGRVEAALDRSVPQIGAPAAWEAGFDGTGVTVAVLDTGVDATHPDLADRVAAERNFSAAEDAADHFGHGTHVASIIAGSGAASEGAALRGVAPGARILNGKVLDDGGSGSESDIIAGMEWAVEQGADVVNLSLGGTDLPALDPMEEAVDALSADSAALFVIAAGNSGPTEQSVGSPGSARAALTVGAVDREDALAPFSSRGPTADGSLKPDLTAPGVEIVAARAAGTEMGEIVGEHYVVASGTSMATPHVAGAAALLAQAHPDWDGERIKETLTASAEPAAGLDAYQQGSGRVDVARAIGQAVTTSPTSLGFGVQEFPHEDDAPVTERLAYRNAGDAPVTLDLAVTAFGPEGAPAPDGMFAVRPARLTVPAGGEATATVTADTRPGDVDGLYGGTVTATAAAGDVRAVTPLGVWREGPAHDVTIRHLDAAGAPAPGSVTSFVALDRPGYRWVEADENGEATIRLPEGDYVAEATVTGEGEGASRIALLISPSVPVTEDAMLVMDARRAEPFDVTVPNGAATPSLATYDYQVSSDEGGLWATWFMDGLDTLSVADLGPALPADRLRAAVTASWDMPNEGAAPAQRYRAAWSERGSLLTGLTHHIAPGELATVRITAGSPAAGKAGILWAGTVDESGSLLIGDDVELPTEAVDHVLANGTRWLHQVTQGTVSEEGWLEQETSVSTAPRAHQPGERREELLNVGVFGPTLNEGLDGTPGAWRSGDEISAWVGLFGDGAGHQGDSRYTEGSTRLVRDGEEVFADDLPLHGQPMAVPAAEGRYELTTEVSRDAQVAPVSSRIEATWTFRSGPVPEGETEALPLSTVRFGPRLALDSTARAGHALEVPFTVEGSAAEVGVRELAFEVSYDDGATWRPVDSVRADRFTLDHPDDPGTVSLRATLTDADGNTLEQTIHRAYTTTR
ncbi:S8 family peptidase [Allostreptomyces psammosilenae]|uniref:Subtilisin family serine protease n=1 Tax=Allostreptomyces psammosilenae TaxID=1892865 RepID=A0A853A3Z4_9ACTN|nr:S8 family peptidase [Allostreptomyces psammosilenae]NYI07604.1 subtilisin family serine protease [Allostreptomyces psammosilenae]